MKNDSGFHGYPMASLYPDYGGGVSQTLETVPDAREQEHLSANEVVSNQPIPVDKKSKHGIWWTVGVLIVLLILFGAPKLG